MKPWLGTLMVFAGLVGLSGKVIEELPEAQRSVGLFMEVGVGLLVLLSCLSILSTFAHKPPKVIDAEERKRGERFEGVSRRGWDVASGPAGPGSSARRS